MKIAVITFAAAAALAACTPATRTLINESVQGIKDAEDAKARLALQAPCAITIGAANRVLSDAERRAAQALCGGDAERPVTIEELQRVLATQRE